MSNIDRLTIRQEKFCLEYAKSGNATESYKKAGYKYSNDEVARVNATKLLQKHNIQARLREIQAELEAEDIIEIKEVKQKLTAIIRQECTDEVVTLKGNKINVKNSVRDALKAIELWGKMAGAFITRQELEVSGAVPVVFSGEDRIAD